MSKTWYLNEVIYYKRNSKIIKNKNNNSKRFLLRLIVCTEAWVRKYNYI